MVLGTTIIVVEIGRVIFERVAFDPLVLGIGVVMLGYPIGSLADIWTEKFPRRKGGNGG